MGRSIFSLLAESPADLTVLGRDPAAMDREARRCERRQRRAAGLRKLDDAPGAPRPGAVRFTTSWDDLRGCDLVIETVSEDDHLKREVLRRAEDAISPDAVLTSNTSGISIARLAGGLREPGRFCGFHFFHPVRLTTVVEIITAPRTARRVVERLREVCRAIGRTPLVVKDLAGSCLNVPLILHCCEAMYVLEQGLAQPSRIDELVGRRIARVGPCETIDAIGIPLATELLRGTLVALGSDQPVPALSQRLIGDGRLGRYAGGGIYIYREDRPIDDAPGYYHNPAQTHSPPVVRADEQGLYERLVFPVYHSLLRLSQDGRADLHVLCLGARDVLGLKVDPMAEMRRLGSSGLRAAFDRLATEVGPRFSCARLHSIMAAMDGR
jgi:3-hydroxybutyryl-CoA dehydrogenase